jgi:Ca2+-binding EF-hand superfamily protein
MKTTRLFVTLATSCTVAALVGCVSTNRQVSESSLDEKNLKREEIASSSGLSQPVMLEERAFQGLDVNGDRAVTLDEWRYFDTSARAKDTFTALDENGDGQINLIEFLTGRAHQTLDLKADGTLTLNEWQHVDTSTEAKEHFHALDENGDGRINAPEFLWQSPAHLTLYPLLGSTDKTQGSYPWWHEELFQQPGLQVFSIRF